MKTIKLNVSMHCGSCEGRIQDILKDKTENVLVNVASQRAKITFEESKISEEEVISQIEGLGYAVSK